MKTTLELAQEILEQANQEVIEYNELVDYIEKLENENTFVKLQNKTLTASLTEEQAAHKATTSEFETLKSQCDQVYKNGEKHLIAAKQAYRERDQMADKYNLVNDQLKAYKEIGTAKKIRERIKDYQAKVALGTTNLNKSKDLIKEYRKEITRHIATNKQLKASEAQSNLTTVWSENGDHLLLFPAKLSMGIGDTVEKQLTLLYMTKSGCGKLIGLDEEGNPAVCRMPAGGLKPKKRTIDTAGEILRKWKRQNWTVTIDDLDLAGK